MDPERWIHITAEPGYVARYDGQVALLTLTNLLARMTPSVAIDAPYVPLVEPLPWVEEDLPELALSVMHAIDPHGRFGQRPSQPGDYSLRLGPTGDRFVAHGSGWGAYIGPEPSPIQPSDPPNPFGPAFAAVIAAAHLFATDFGAPPARSLFSTLDWSMEWRAHGEPQPIGGMPIGTLWVAGTGSVGTAILYFLTLLTRSFSCTLFDMDEVKVHNLDRSPIFVNSDVGSPKVLAVEQFLRQAGVTDVRAEACALHESAIWRDRQEGTPDLLLSAANERDVRYRIESAYPPVQVYGTTGKNWQASVIRHVPLVDACSKCLFPRESGVPTDCAVGSAPHRSNGDQVDAALPFLSFAAGLMAAAEVLKLGLPGFPHGPNRSVLNTFGRLRTASAVTPRADTCLCSERISSVHRQMIRGSRYAHLSDGPTLAVM